jgi:agmatine deiminase
LFILSVLSKGLHGKNPKCAESVAHAGEFEPHANAWMGWPDSGMLWREDAKPAQKQYADVAKAISQFEPVVMMANPEVCTHTKNNCACILHCD